MELEWADIRREKHREDYEDRKGRKGKGGREEAAKMHQLGLYSLNFSLISIHLLFGQKKIKYGVSCAHSLMGSIINDTPTMHIRT